MCDNSTGNIFAWYVKKLTEYLILRKFILSINFRDDKTVCIKWLNYPKKIPSTKTAIHLQTYLHCKLCIFCFGFANRCFIRSGELHVGHVRLSKGLINNARSSNDRLS